MHDVTHLLKNRHNSTMNSFDALTTNVLNHRHNSKMRLGGLVTSGTGW